MLLMFYGEAQAAIHHERFGKLAGFAAEDLIDLLHGSDIGRGTVVDLGCGSGIAARRLFDAGYDVMGVDISPDMINIARQAAPSASFSVGTLYDFQLPIDCVGVLASGEAMNYGTDPNAGAAAFRELAVRVREALIPGGWWLFDISGPGRAPPAPGTKQFHRHDDWCLGMTAVESSEGDRLDREITIFTKNPDNNYQRIEEYHVLHLFKADDTATALKNAGFVVELLDDYRSAPFVLHLPGWFVVKAQNADPRL
jgi:SAM-dependent methyltransferase